MAKPEPLNLEPDDDNDGGGAAAAAEGCATAVVEPAAEPAAEPATHSSALQKVVEGARSIAATGAPLLVKGPLTNLYTRILAGDPGASQYDFSSNLEPFADDVLRGLGEGHRVLLIKRSRVIINVGAFEATVKAAAEGVQHDQTKDLLEMFGADLPDTGTFPADTGAGGDAGTDAGQPSDTPALRSLLHTVAHQIHGLLRQRYDLDLLDVKYPYTAEDASPTRRDEILGEVVQDFFRTVASGSRRTDARDRKADTAAEVLLNAARSTSHKCKDAAPPTAILAISMLTRAHSTSAEFLDILHKLGVAMPARRMRVLENTQASIAARNSDRMGPGPDELEEMHVGMDNIDMATKSMAFGQARHSMLNLVFGPAAKRLRVEREHTSPVETCPPLAVMPKGQAVPDKHPDTPYNPGVDLDPLLSSAASVKKNQVNVLKIRDNQRCWGFFGAAKLVATGTPADALYTYESDVPAFQRNYSAGGMTPSVTDLVVKAVPTIPSSSDPIGNFSLLEAIRNALVHKGQPDCILVADMGHISHILPIIVQVPRFNQSFLVKPGILHQEFELQIILGKALLHSGFFETLIAAGILSDIGVQRLRAGKLLQLGKCIYSALYHNLTAKFASLHLEAHPERKGEHNFIVEVFEHLGKAPTLERVDDEAGDFAQPEGSSGISERLAAHIQAVMDWCESDAATNSTLACWLPIYNIIELGKGLRQNVRLTTQDEGSIFTRFPMEQTFTGLCFQFDCSLYSRHYCNYMVQLQQAYKLHPTAYRRMAGDSKTGVQPKGRLMVGEDQVVEEAVADGKASANNGSTGNLNVAADAAQFAKEMLLYAPRQMGVEAARMLAGLLPKKQKHTYTRRQEWAFATMLRDQLAKGLDAFGMKDAVNIVSYDAVCPEAIEQARSLFTRGAELVVGFIGSRITNREAGVNIYSPLKRQGTRLFASSMQISKKASASAKAAQKLTEMMGTVNVLHSISTANDDLDTPLRWDEIVKFPLQYRTANISDSSGELNEYGNCSALAAALLNLEAVKASAAVLTYLETVSEVVPETGKRAVVVDGSDSTFQFKTMAASAKRADACFDKLIEAVLLRANVEGAGDTDYVYYCTDQHLPTGVDIKMANSAARRIVASPSVLEFGTLSEVPDDLKLSAARVLSMLRSPANMRTLQRALHTYIAAGKCHPLCEWLSAKAGRAFVMAAPLKDTTDGCAVHQYCCSAQGEPSSSNMTDSPPCDLLDDYTVTNSPPCDLLVDYSMAVLDIPSLGCAGTAAGGPMALPHSETWSAQFQAHFCQQVLVLDGKKVGGSLLLASGEADMAVCCTADAHKFPGVTYGAAFGKVGNLKFVDLHALAEVLSEGVAKAVRGAHVLTGTRHTAALHGMTKRTVVKVLHGAEEDELAALAQLGDRAYNLGETKSNDFGNLVGPLRRFFIQIYHSTMPNKEYMQDITKATLSNMRYALYRNMKKTLPELNFVEEQCDMHVLRAGLFANWLHLASGPGAPALPMPGDGGFALDEGGELEPRWMRTPEPEAKLLPQQLLGQFVCNCGKSSKSATTRFCGMAKNWAIGKKIKCPCLALGRRCTDRCTCAHGRCDNQAAGGGGGGGAAAVANAAPAGDFSEYDDEISEQSAAANDALAADVAGDAVAAVAVAAQCIAEQDRNEDTGSDEEDDTDGARRSKRSTARGSDGSRRNFDMYR